MGVHLTANDIFKGIVLKQRKVAREKLAREKTVCERQEKVESNAMIIQAAKGGDVTVLSVLAASDPLLDFGEKDGRKVI